MSIIEKLNILDRRFAWSFLGFLLASIFGAFAIYVEFYRNRNPDLRFELVTNASVVDVREELPKLEVRFDGAEITKENKALRVIVFRIANRGSGNVLMSNYDESVPLGFRVDGGEIIRADIPDATNKYLEQAVKIEKNMEGDYKLSPVILDSGDSFSIKLLVLHPRNTTPQVKVLGKIAGDPRIELVDLSVSNVSQGLWSQAFRGGFWTQLLRLLGYFLGFVVIILATAIPIGIGTSAISRQKRARRVKRFKAATKLELTNEDEFIFEGYTSNGTYFPHLLIRAASDLRLTVKVRYYLVAEGRKQTQETGRGSSRLLEEELGTAERNELEAAEIEGLAALKNRDLLEYMTNLDGARASPRFLGGYPLKEMIEHRFIYEVDGTWHVSSDRNRTLTAFMEYLDYVGAA